MGFMLDKKGRLFGYISIVDLFAVVMVAAIFFAVWSLAGSRPTLEGEQDVYVTFRVAAVQDFTALALQHDVPVMDDDGGIHLGRVVDFVVGDSEAFLPDRAGNRVATTLEGYYSVSLTTRVPGRLTDGAVVLGGRLYAVGSEVHLWAGGVRLIMYVTAIVVA